MLRNYLLTAFRNLTKSPLYSFINVFSLAIGIAACIVIYLFINDEVNFDSTHSKKEHIYRLDEVQNFTGTEEQKVALSMPGMGPSMLNDFPEVTNFTRYWDRGTRLFTKETTQLTVEHTVMVDSTFLEIFDFKLAAGNRESALDEPNSLLLTKETALKFFNTPQEALGNTLSMGDQLLKITAVLEDVPETSHLQYNALLSMTDITREEPEFNDQWGSNFLNTYLIIEPGSDLAHLESKFDDFMIRHMESEEVINYYSLFLQPLSEVHLGSMDIEHDYNNYRKFNGDYLDIFTLVGLFILIIASVNFMNLTTARASHRWKEIGVRKAIGALKQQLFYQFILESILMAIFALFLSIVLNLVFIPWLNVVIGRQLSLLSLLENPIAIGVIALTSLLLGVLAGLYPSLYMTAVKSIKALKGSAGSSGKSIYRSALVVIQFGLALGMIVSTLVVVKQLSYMRNKDVGFVTNQMMLIEMSGEANDKFETLKTELLKSKYVEGVTASGQRIGNNFHQWGFKVKTDTGLYEMSPSNVAVDFDYLDVYGIRLKDGRSFSKAHSTDDGLAYIINESLAEELGLKDPVGTAAAHSWYPDDSLGSIIGVTEDFNFNSLHHKVNTLAMVVHSAWGYDEMSVKVKGEDIPAAIAEVKNIWEAQIDTWPFEYTFLDEHFDNLYKSDEQMSAVVTIMAVLAIIIACMGLFGLASITTKRKIKEIGIRKVLGASGFQITYLLSRNFTLLIMLAFVLVSPVTYFILESWLTNFAFKVSISPLTFLLGAILALVIALVTIGYHTIKASRENPVKALRYE
ncbi:FtsX-like permease family protein [Fulvivirga sp. M361]|uniref:ABC transporter permease n=1 Tax=Fulvivirga sp. M361 TaxID=2594266 RepID=UPI00117BB303|nr:ABC transporter permease [Fulvivirga sp. M361]TRX52028.1 FtsX-like permease family protein [Fulvivirga sp. M361]